MPDPLLEVAKLQTRFLPLLIACAAPPVAAPQCAAQSVQRRVVKSEDRPATWIQALQHAQARQRWLAVHRLVACGQPAVPALLEALTREDLSQPGTANLAAEALRRMGAAATSAIPRLLELLETDSLAQRVRVCRILAALTPFAPEHAAAAQEKLVTLLMSPSGLSIHHQVVPSLVRIQQSPVKRSTEQLLRDVASRDATRRIRAAEILAGRDLGTDRRRVVQALTRACKEERQPCHTSYEFDLGGHHFERVARTHHPTAVPRHLALALRRLRAPVPCAGWIALSKNPDPEERRQAILALGASGDPAAVPALIERLRDPDARLEGEAITALGMLGPVAKPGIPALRAYLSGPHPGLAARAEAALKRIESTGR